MAHDRMRRAYGKRQKRDARPCLNAVAAAASGAEVRRKLRGPGIAVTAENGKKTLKMQSGKERRRNRGDAVLPCDGRRKALSAASAFADALAACQNAPSFACAIGERRAGKEGASAGPASETPMMTALQAKEPIAEQSCMERENPGCAPGFLCAYGAQGRSLSLGLPRICRPKCDFYDLKRGGPCRRTISCEPRCGFLQTFHTKSW